MANKSSGGYLHEAMIFNILSFLPVLSLVRCKSVCKTWLSIISSPEFAEAHLINSKKKQASVLKASFDWRLWSINSLDHSVRLRLPSHCQGMVRYMRSCNGLVCLSDKYCDVICVWNPCTRMFKMLPSCKRNAERVPLYLGFGFDCVGNDYKVLRVAFPDDYPSSEAEGEVYSANADSWKKIQVPQVRKSFWLTPRENCGSDINGVLYLEGKSGLLSFDLHNEVFGKIGVLQFPYHVEHNPFFSVGPEPKFSNVLDFEGCVAMIFKFVNDSFPSLWTLDDVCGSWTKKFNLETDLKLNRVYLYLGLKHFVVLDYVSRFKFYDYEKKTIKDLSFPAQCTDINSVVNFTESLVSLNGFEHQKQSGSFKGKKQLSVLGTRRIS